MDASFAREEGCWQLCLARGSGTAYDLLSSCCQICQGFVRKYKTEG